MCTDKWHYLGQKLSGIKTLKFQVLSDFQGKCPHSPESTRGGENLLNEIGFIFKNWKDYPIFLLK